MEHIFILPFSFDNIINNSLLSTILCEIKVILSLKNLGKMLVKY
jgi:hypothetical protein